MHAFVGQGVRKLAATVVKLSVCFVFMQICDDELSALKGNNKPHPAVKQFYSCGPLSTELVTPGTPEPLIGLHLICYRKKKSIQRKYINCFITSWLSCLCKFMVLK